MARPTISVTMRSTSISARGAVAHLAVAEDDDVVAEPQHVAEDVADVDDRDAARLEPVDDREPLGSAPSAASSARRR